VKAEGHIFVCPTCGCPIRSINMKGRVVYGECPVCDKFVQTSKTVKYFRYDLKFSELLYLIELLKEGYTPIDALKRLNEKRDRKLSDTTINRIILVTLKTLGFIRDKTSWGYVAIILSEHDKISRIIILLNILWNIFAYDAMVKFDEKEIAKRRILTLINQGIDVLSKEFRPFTSRATGPLDVSILGPKIEEIKRRLRKLEESVSKTIEFLTKRGIIEPTTQKELKKKLEAIKEFSKMLFNYEKNLIEISSSTQKLREILKGVKKISNRNKKRSSSTRKRYFYRSDQECSQRGGELRYQ